ncbi:MAG: DUF2764 family protein [Proteiniphilum sp.]|jgi:hypothetical protein|nr:DUF2764 family protein [Proteiniphilum sp.]
MLFKNQYYYFVSGLPDFTFDSMKLPLTVEKFKVLLDEELRPEDKRLLSNYFLQFDNANLLNLLKSNDVALNNKGNLSIEELQDAIEEVKEGDTIGNKLIPPFFEATIKRWLDDEVQNESRTLEDLISSFYMDYGLEAKNSLISRWFELNLNIGNILSAIYARKYDMDVTKVVVGNNKLAMIIRENANARDFGITLELDYFDAIQRLSEEGDIYERERKLDKFRWEWLEQNTTLDYFNIEYIFAYLCKLQILERWVSLNAVEGERVFRDLITGLKNGIEMPDES